MNPYSPLEVLFAWMYRSVVRGRRRRSTVSAARALARRCVEVMEVGEEVTVGEPGGAMPCRTYRAELVMPDFGQASGRPAVDWHDRGTVTLVRYFGTPGGVPGVALLDRYATVRGEVATRGDRLRRLAPADSAGPLRLGSENDFCWFGADAGAVVGRLAPRLWPDGRMDAAAAAAARTLGYSIKERDVDGERRPLTGW